MMSSYEVLRQSPGELRGTRVREDDLARLSAWTSRRLHFGNKASSRAEDSSCLHIEDFISLDWRLITGVQQAGNCTY